MNIDPNDPWRHAAQASVPLPSPVRQATPMQQALAAALLGPPPVAPQVHVPSHAPMPSPALQAEPLPSQPPAAMASGAPLPVPMSAYQFTAQDYARLARRSGGGAIIAAGRRACPD